MQAQTNESLPNDSRAHITQEIISAHFNYNPLGLDVDDDRYLMEQELAVLTTNHEMLKAQVKFEKNEKQRLQQMVQELEARNSALITRAAALVPACEKPSDVPLRNVAPPTPSRSVRTVDIPAEEDLSTTLEALVAAGGSIRKSASLKVMRSSALALPVAFQAIIYVLAAAGVILVLFAPVYIKTPNGRLLGSQGRNSNGEPVIASIAYCMVAACLMSFSMYIMRQPCLLGYILGGVLVGPKGINLVHDDHHITTVSELGLILLLFMIGLELNIKQLLSMGRLVLATGLCQFPISASVLTGLWYCCSALGFGIGSGKYSNVYFGICCSLPSTMIVVKLLSDRMETDTRAGRLSVGILVFQDVWAIIALSVQTNAANPGFMSIFQTFALMVALVAVSFLYSKYVLPAILAKASKSLEMMMVLSLGWCFFICCAALLPNPTLSMEFAALIAGISMATYPYCAEFNGKIKHIRDFFLTLYFVALGMRIPQPSFAVVGSAILVVLAIISIRWLGIFSVLYFGGADRQIAIMTTINLSQISEFALVLLDKGYQHQHIEKDTMAILVYAFSITAVLAYHFISNNVTLTHYASYVLAKCLGGQPLSQQNDSGHCVIDSDRDILFLGFHRIASAIVCECEVQCPTILKRMHVIDTNTSIIHQLRKKNIVYSYGDISEPEVVESLQHGHAKLVLSTVPDLLLVGVSNARVLEMSKMLWPEALIIVTAEDREEADELYNAGAAYVLRASHLCADKIAGMLTQHVASGLSGSSLQESLEQVAHVDHKALMKEPAQFFPPELKNLKSTS